MVWELKHDLSSRHKQLRHWIKMRRGVDETRTELRSIESTDGAVYFTSTAWKNSMAAFLTLSLSHLVAAGSMHSYHSSKRSKKLRVKGLGESISNHVFCRYVGNSNFFGVDFFPDPVMWYLNMFSAPVKLRIGCKYNNSSVISF